MMKKLVENKAQCKLCGDILLSELTHDKKTCNCGNLTIDGGLDYIRRSWKQENSFIELSVETLGRNWINDEIEIDFDVPKGIQDLINELEKLDDAEDYAYFNYSDALDCAAKELVKKGKLTTSQWNKLCAKYDG